MNGPVVIAASVVTGLAAVGIAAWWAAERAEAKARAVLDTGCVCSSCRQTPVLLPGAECGACLSQAPWSAGTDANPRRRYICPLCEMQRVPMPNAPCAICVHAFHEELDRWEALP